MPTTRKKSSKKVSVVEPCTTPPDPCPLCGRSGPIEPAAEPAAEPPAITSSVTADEIEEAFDSLPVQLPPSVRKRITARLLKRSLHPTSEEGVELIRTTCAQYLAKKERAKVASAARRAVAKQQKEAAIPDGDGTDSPVLTEQEQSEVVA